MNESMKRLVVSLGKKEINNLYRPNSKYESESLTEVEVNKGFTFEYAPVLLKEWFFLLKPGGRLVINYAAAEKKEDEMEFERILWWLFRGNYEIESHKIARQKGTIVVKKKHSQFVPGDSIEKWTFGIITNGDRDDWMEEIIASIRALKIPHYEIIVCGKYRDRNEKDFIYIPFNERADKGWITKKKNLICERASFENLCIIHDRLIFDRDWYKGMKRYGNAFEILGAVQVEKETGEQAGDWLTLGGPMGTLYKISRLEYWDWDYYVYIGGMYTVLKKSIWKDIQWDETRYWNGAEDADISFRARDRGYIIRFNPFSKCVALAWRHGKLPLKYKLSDGLIPKDMLLRRLMRSSVRIALCIPVFNKIVEVSTLIVTKSKMYKYFIYH